MEQITIKEIDFKKAKEYCSKFHYSKTLPSSSKYKLEISVDGKPIGVITFGKGACPYIPKIYNLDWSEVYELTRIALDTHTNIFVSKILKMCINYIKKQEPKLKLLFSFADSGQNHKGIVYRASGWFFERISARKGDYYFNIKTNLKVHPKSFYGWVKKSGLSEKDFLIKYSDTYKKVPTSKKYCYLYFLDKKYKKQYAREHNLNWKTMFNVRQDIQEII